MRTRSPPSLIFLSGLCALDIAEFIHYSSFAPIAYLTLKRDCQYWCTDVDDEEEMLLNHANEV